ncbi:unnamed protein product [Rhizopus stolonifer]
MSVLEKAFDTFSYENKPIERPDRDIPVQNSALVHDIMSSPKPMSEISLFELMLNDACRQFPHKKALFIDPKDPSKRITYGQFKEQVLKCAASLKREYGLQRGDVIATCSPDLIEYAILFYGALAAGCVFSPMRHSAISTAEDIVYDFHTLQPKLLILHASEMNTLYSTARDSGLSESNILALGDRSKDPAYANVRTVNDVLLSSQELAEPYRYTRDEIVNSPCFLYFTSGSTGRRKAVILTQNSMVHYILAKGISFDSSYNSLIITSFSFVSSLFSCLLNSIFFGASVYFLDQDERTVKDVCKAVDKYKINFLILPPYIVYELGKEPQLAKTYDMSSLKEVRVGGATVDQTMVHLVKETTGVAIVNMYAMTECIGITCNDTENTLAGSIGRLGYSNLSRIVDNDGNDLPVGSIGELRVKGPTMTSGYYRNPEATAELFDDQGYIRTGDLCRVDKDGLYYFVNRVKDLIKHKMFYFYPIDVEKVLITHPSISDCAVIGIESEEHGTEVARAYVTLVDKTCDKDKILKEIREFTEAQLPESKHLHGGIFEIENFPRTGSGKIQRFELRQLVKDQV